MTPLFNHSHSHNTITIIQADIDLLDAVALDPNVLIEIDIPSSWKTMRKDEIDYVDRHMGKNQTICIFCRGNSTMH